MVSGMPVPRPRVLVFLSRILGNNQLGMTIERELTSLAPDIDFTVIWFESRHYRMYAPPRWLARFVRPFESAWCARRMLRESKLGALDAAIVSTMELAHAARPWTAGRPLLLVTDTTDRLSHAQVAAASGSYSSVIVTLLKDAITGIAYRPVMRGVTAVLSESEWCAQSVIADYGLPPESVRVAMGQLDLKRWAPASTRSERSRCRILFVGNDVRRKGGDILLRAMAGPLQGRCELVMISQDPWLSAVKIPKGVTIQNGYTHERIDDLIREYQQSDIFVFPTWIDKLPQSVREAAAIGLPIVARDCGGIGSVVRDRWNGRLLPFSATDMDFVTAVLELVEDPTARARYGANSRTLAESELSVDNLRERLRWGVSQLLSDA